jgi:ArsR family transcriptional regulator
MARSDQATRRGDRSRPADIGRISPALTLDGAMTAPHALVALAALGQPSRLQIFRALVRCEPDGIPAGQIADMVGAPHNTASSHLAILVRAGLIAGTREGRSIIYRANLDGIGALIGFLLTDCCGGRPEVCRPVSRAMEMVRGKGRRGKKITGGCDEEY